eukprot:c20165_g1_i1 orf=176-2293(-)
MFPSKAERIMARFRPIAPKPVGYTSNWPLACETLTSSTSGESLGAGQISDCGKSRKSRKRHRDSDGGVSKRLNSGKHDKPGCSSGTVTGACVETAKTPSKTRFERNAGELEDFGHFLPVSCPGSVSRGNLYFKAARNTPSDSPEAAEGRRPGFSLHMGTIFAFDSSNGVECGVVAPVNSGSLPSSEALKRDDALMQRTAARVSPSVLSERIYGVTINKENQFGDCFMEMIRGIASLPTSAEIHTLMYPKLTTEDMRASTISMKGDAAVSSTRMPFPQAGLQHASKCRSENGLVVPIREREEVTHVVTLPLLPEIPCHGYSSVQSSLSTCTSEQTTLDLGALSEIKVGDVGGRPSSFLFWADLGATPVTSGCNSTCNYDNTSGTLKNHICPQLADRRYIEEVHGNSSEPVLLVDDLHRVLWFNKAYDRAAKSILKRGSVQVWEGPYIDPLGHPTVLGTVNLKSSNQTGSLSATLWGFLKKLVIQESDRLREGIHMGSLPGSLKGTPSYVRESDPVPAERLLSDLEQKTAAQHRGESKKNEVIMPNPKRLVGSTVSLVGVTEALHSNDSPSTSLAAIEAQLEESILPSFITDSSNRVRWVNSAYKQMVGQPECHWLASTVTTSSSCKSDVSSAALLQSPRPNGEVSFVWSSKFPETATAFSGKVNIQWINNGETSSLTVPCEVARMEDQCRGWMRVWKLYVAHSLRD